MKVAILTETFDPWQAIADYQRHARGQGVSHYPGATAVFVGSMRDMNAGNAVESMWIEHYPAMTQKYLTELAAEVLHKHAVDDILVLHRVGQIHLADPIVLVAVWSQHRDAAYKANREIMEMLKSHAPFWKKEKLTAASDNQSERWVVQQQ